MKVQFEFTVQDLAEVAAKHASRSRVVQSARSSAHLMWAGLIGLSAFAIVPAALIGRVLSGLGAFFVSTMIWKRPGTRSQSAMMLKYYREQLGSDGPFTCEVELNESGLRIRQFETEMVHPWTSVASIDLVAEGVEIRVKPMGLVLVRERAFANSEQQEMFLRRARELQSRT